jgi:uncharacterized membrane protein YkgB
MSMLIDHLDAPRAAGALVRTGRAVALAGVLLPMALIGGMKFTTVEIEALTPLISATPWLAWLHPLFGINGAPYFLGVVELATAVLLALSPWSRSAGLAGGVLASITFLLTCSLMFALPIWDPTLGAPALGPLGQFLIKDVALLGIALVVTGESFGARPRMA